jgi:putative ABC transport system permease protein
MSAALDVAIRLLLHDRIRFAATVFGLGVAILLILLQLGFLEVLLNRATSTIEQIDADIWVVSRNVETVDLPVQFSEELVWVVRSTPGVARADNLLVQYVNAVRRTGELEAVLVYAMKDFQPWDFPRVVVDGSTSDLRNGRVCLIDGSASNVRRFGPVHKGDFTVLQGMRTMVVGISHEVFCFTASPIALMSDSTFREIARTDRFDGLTSYVLVRVAPGTDVRAVQRALQNRLPREEVLLKSEWQTRTRRYWLLTTGLGLNMAMNICLGLLVGIAVLSLNLYVVTMEHFREFGTIKAIGGRNSDIHAIVAFQGLTYGVLSFVLAWAGLKGAALLLARVDLAPNLSVLTLCLAFLFSLGLALLASMISFRRISRIDPFDVMRN